MWTPKRILMLGGSFALFFLLFLSYGFSSVGRIDGLPPLPDSLAPNGAPAVEIVEKSGPPKVDQRLEQAFGKGCAELDRPIKLDIRSRGLLLSAVDFIVLDDGRVSMMPISAAIFGKDPRNPEISFIRGDVAYIKFDRPVRNFSEINSRKIEAAEISGKITIVNNRKRPERDQDLRIAIPHGPLHFNEKTHKIWTSDHIEVRDYKSAPEPHVVKGTGMEMELAVEPQAAPNGKTREAVGGVKWLVLKSNVDMTLHTDGKQSFFDTGAGPGGKAKAGGPPKRSVVRVTTPGSFRYDMSDKGRDVATFDTPPPPPAGSPAAAPQVRVHRENFAPPSNDRLACTHLQLNIKRRDAKAKEKAEGESFQVETVRATGPDGEVVLTSDVERLDARGGDFFHDAQRGVTVLKGRTEVSGAQVVKDDSEVWAKELHIQKRPAAVPKPGAAPAKDGYDVRATGPGRLHFRDTKEKRTLHAFWTKVLTLGRDKDEDLVTLLGDARFVDEAGGQSLSADELKVWFDGQDTAGGKDGRRPRHLEANRNVRAQSREMNITDNSRLVVWFRDEPQAKPAAPAPAPAPKAAAAAGPKPPPGTPIVGTPTVPGAPARPFDLKARSIQTRIIRGAAKSSVDELFCEGAVVVTQAPAKPGEKGTEVKGDTLKMNAAPNGCYVLDVVGDTAELRTERITVMGPQVVIDQDRNMAWVVGDGAMTMDSQTNFQGDRLKDPVPMTVLWKDRMFFNGTSATFDGDIQATQDNSRMACQHMEVTFDRVVSLKQGAKGEPNARVRYMVCSKDVKVEETLTRGKELVKYQRLDGTELMMQALEVDDGVKVPGAKTTAGNRVTTTGPGSFRVVQAGSTAFDPLAPAAPKAAPAKKDDVGLKMTYVAFQKRMDANSNTGVASFWENVRVLHVPVVTADAKVDLNTALATELPEGGLYLRGDRLRVMDKETDGKPNKRMVAEGNVRVQGRDFDATADIVRFDEAKDQIVFEGKDGPATLRKFEAPGSKPQVVSARTIVYNRKTKNISLERTDSIFGTTGN